MTTSVFSFIVVLGVLIFFHELGHFLIAKLFGVGVEKFSLGFGPRILGKKVGITDYRISAIPLGGYVKMVGDEPDSELSPDQIPHSFTHKPVLKRMLIVAAGPAFNLLLAAIIFFGFFAISGIDDVTPVVRYVEKGGVAEKAGLREGDRVISINGHAIESWYDIGEWSEDKPGQPLTVKYRRDVSVRETVILPELKTGQDIFGDETTYFSVGMFGLPELKAFIGGVSPGTPAQKSGLKKGDQVIAIDGKKVANWKEMSDIIAGGDGRALDFDISRQGTVFSVSITPALTKRKNAIGETEERYLIGISTASAPLPEEDRFVKRLALLDALTASIERTWFVCEISVVGIAKIIDGSISRKNLGGPIMIAKMAGDQAKEGIDKLIQFVAFISINLAILNLLPIPVLDGGHLLFFLVEAIIRRPVGVRVREMAQQAGMFALLLLMVFVFYNDIMRYFFS